MALPQLTDEQRAAALEKAAAARRARAELKDRLKRGGIRIAAYLNWVFENSQDQNGAEARSACKPARRK